MNSDTAASLFAYLIIAAIVFVLGYVMKLPILVIVAWLVLFIIFNEIWIHLKKRRQNQP